MRACVLMCECARVCVHECARVCVCMCVHLFVFACVCMSYMGIHACGHVPSVIIVYRSIMIADILVHFLVGLFVKQHGQFVLFKYFKQTN